MPYAINTYTADGSATTFSVSFPYLSEGDIVVSVGGVVKTLTTDYTVSVSGVTFTTAPTSGLIVNITRNTSQTARLVDYTAGSIFKESDLDTDGLQTFYMSQEAIDIASGSIVPDNNNRFDCGGRVVTNVANPVNDSDVITLGYLGPNLNAINTVSGISSDVTTVAGISSNVTSVAGNSSNITAVAGNATNINTVAGMASDVTTAIGMSSDITAVVGNATNINAVVGNATNINTVAGMATDLIFSISMSSDISAVVGNATNINAVAGNQSNINTVAGMNTQINTCATNVNEISVVALNQSNIVTVATNINDVNKYADTYFTGSTAPSSPSIGDLWFDTTANILKVYASAGWQAASASISTSSSRITYTVGTNSGSYNTGSLSVFPVAYDAGFIDVYLNGVKLVSGTDYTASNGTEVGLTSNATAGDVIQFVAYGNNILNDVSTLSPYATDIGTVSTNITDVETVADNISTVGTVATNIANINSVANPNPIKISRREDVVGHSTLGNSSTVNAEWSVGGGISNYYSALELGPLAHITREISVTPGKTYTLYINSYSSSMALNFFIGTTSGASNILQLSNSSLDNRFVAVTIPSGVSTVYLRVANPVSSARRFTDLRMFDLEINSGYELRAFHYQSNTTQGNFVSPSKYTLPAHPTSGLKYILPNTGGLLPGNIFNDFTLFMEKP